MVKKTPKFLSKLHRLIEDPTNSDIITWSPSGKSFIIKNPHRFCKELLPRTFKTNVFSSFIRQLNVYNFHKSKSPSSPLTTEYQNDYFQRNHPDQISLIKRIPKKSQNISSSSLSCYSSSNEDDDLESIRQKTIGYTKRVSVIKKNITLLENKVNILSYFNSDLFKRNAVIRSELYRMQEKRRKLEKFFVELTRSFCPKMRREGMMQEERNEVVNMIFKKVKDVRDRVYEERYGWVREFVGSEGYEKGRIDAKSEFLYNVQLKEFQSKMIEQIEEHNNEEESFSFSDARENSIGEDENN